MSKNGSFAKNAKNRDVKMLKTIPLPLENITTSYSTPRAEKLKK